MIINRFTGDRKIFPIKEHCGSRMVHGSAYQVTAGDCYCMLYPLSSHFLSASLLILLSKGKLPKKISLREPVKSSSFCFVFAV